MTTYLFEVFYSICKYLNAYYVWHLRKNTAKLQIYSIPSSCLSSRVGQSVHLLSRVLLSATPWTAARQASLYVTNSWSLLKLMSIELVMPSNHLILCRPLLLLSVFPGSRGCTLRCVHCFFRRNTFVPSDYRIVNA